MITAVESFHPVCWFSAPGNTVQTIGCLRLKKTKQKKKFMQTRQELAVFKWTLKLYIFPLVGLSVYLVVPARCLSSLKHWFKTQKCYTQWIPRSGQSAWRYFHFAKSTSSHATHAISSRQQITNSQRCYQFEDIFIQLAGQLSTHNNVLKRHEKHDISPISCGK